MACSFSCPCTIIQQPDGEIPPQSRYNTCCLAGLLMKSLMFDEDEIPERRCRSVLDGSGRVVSARAFILLRNRPRNIPLKYRGVGLARIRQKWGGSRMARNRTTNR